MQCECTLTPEFGPLTSRQPCLQMPAGYGTNADLFPLSCSSYFPLLVHACVFPAIQDPTSWLPWRSSQTLDHSNLKPLLNSCTTSSLTPATWHWTPQGCLLSPTGVTVLRVGKSIWQAKPQLARSNSHPKTRKVALNIFFKNTLKSKFQMTSISEKISFFAFKNCSGRWHWL